jgi:hypothetical protein
MVNVMASVDEPCASLHACLEQDTFGLKMQEKTEKTSIEIAKSKIPAQLRALFCEPPLLEGEDPNLYWGLVVAVIDERRPVTPMDWIAVNDLVTKLWEERGFRRASNALIRGGMLEAVKYFLGEVDEGETKLKSMSDFPSHRANRYFSRKLTEKNEIRSLLAQFGITEAELYAKAAQQNCDALQMFERMIASRERSRRKQRKEDDRRRREQRQAEMSGREED